jgi:hypothetical protein
LSEEYSVSRDLIVKESFWPVEFHFAQLTHENNKITGMPMDGSKIRNFPINETSAVAQSSPCRDNPG